MPYILDNGTKLVHCFGEHEAGLVHGRVQDFFQLKAECMARGSLFEDPVFDASQNSLGPRQAELEVVWLRPNKIAKNPKFVVDGFTKVDINQGRLGDCWLLAAIADLTQRPEFVSQVIPNGQILKGEQYHGIFHFVFWVAGQYVDVPIDDRLPTVNGKLVYTKSSATNEFWPALLEKAYAKLFGSYSALIGGRVSEALQHCTGGISDFILLKSTNPAATFHSLLELHAQKAFMGASIFKRENSSEINEIKALGLVSGHAYSLTDITWVEVVRGQKTCQVPLIRLRNPWGKFEWRGSWGDSCPQWNLVDEMTKRRLGVVNQDDGEFWMEYRDFVQHFNVVDVCHTNLPDSRPGVYLMADGARLQVDALHGEWRDPETAGGNRCFPATYYLNPKISLAAEEQSRVTVALLQKHRRALKTTAQSTNLYIGLDVFEVEERDMDMPMDRAFFTARTPVVAATCRQINENVLRFTAGPGLYVVVFSAQSPREEGEFLARMVIERSERHTSWMREYVEQIPAYSEEQVSVMKEDVVKQWNDMRRQ